MIVFPEIIFVLMLIVFGVLLLGLLGSKRYKIKQGKFKKSSTSNGFSYSTDFGFFNFDTTKKRLAFKDVILNKIINVDFSNIKKIYSEFNDQPLFKAKDVSKINSMPNYFDCYFNIYLVIDKDNIIPIFTAHQYQILMDGSVESVILKSLGKDKDVSKEFLPVYEQITKDINGLNA